MVAIAALGIIARSLLFASL